MANFSPVAPTIYQADPFAKFKDAYATASGIKNEQDAKKALSDYAASLYGQTQQQGGPTLADLASPPPGANSPAADQMIADSHTAATAATDPTLASYFQKLGMSESGGDPNAKNPKSSAGGLYQITDPTWQALVAQNPNSGLTADGKMDPQQQQIAVRLLTAQNAKALGAAGQPINPGTLYAAHFLGAPTATNVLGYADNTPMASVVSPEVIQANPNLQGMSVGDFKQWAGSQGGNGQGGYQPPQAPPSAAPAAAQPAGNGLPPRDVMLELFRNPQTRAFAVQLAQAATTQRKPIEVNGQLVDPQTMQVVGDFRTPRPDDGTGSDAHDIAGAIMKGDQPPVLTGLYKYSGPVRAELAREGYDLTHANEDWQATTKFLAAANSNQQLRLREATQNVSDALDLTDKLAAQWKGGSFPILNKANLALAKNGAYGPQAQSLATQLDTQIADITSEMANVYMGGNSPTDHALDLAEKQFSSDWSADTLKNAIQLAKTNIAYRRNSLTLGPAGTPNNQYAPQTTQAPPEVSVGPSGVTQAPGTASEDAQPPSGFTGDPSLWKYMTPEERALWQ